jgi:hypothetical protein
VASPKAALKVDEGEFAADLAAVDLPLARHARGELARVCHGERWRPRPNFGASFAGERLGRDPFPKA